MKFIISIVAIFYAFSAFGNVFMEICHDHDASDHTTQSMITHLQVSNESSINNEESFCFHTKLQSEHILSSREEYKAPLFFTSVWYEEPSHLLPARQFRPAIRAFTTPILQQLQIIQNIRPIVILC